MRPRSIRNLAALAGLVAALSCGSADRSAGPGAVTRRSDPTLLAGLNVSAPVANVSVAPDRVVPNPSTTPNAPVSYVSLVPGTFSDGTTATVTNLRTGEHVTATIVDGGFDPQPIPASLDDTLEITVGLAGGKSGPAAFIPVARTAPRIVRTRPPRGQTDVPLNAVITIVFSEPVNSATVNASSVALSDGRSPVAGELGVVPGAPYVVDFTPSAPLAPLTTYTLTVSSAVANLGGTSSESPTFITFTTGSSMTSASLTISPDSAAVTVGSCVELTATLKDAAGQIVSPQPNPAVVQWISSAPDVASASCRMGRGQVSGIGAGTALITASTVWNGARVTATARITVNATTTVVGAIVFRFCNEFGDFCGLYAVDPDGTKGRFLTSSETDFDPIWSPDGTSIAFRSPRACDHATTRICHNDLFVVKPDGSGITGDGSGLRSLTTGIGLDVGGMSWSPDGSRIIFAGAAIPTDRFLEYSLYVMNADGSGLRLLVSPPPGSSFSSPDWSPDGSKIAYEVVTAGDTSAIHVVGADGSNDVRLSTPIAFNGDIVPKWSPDGRRIAFSRWRRAPHIGIEWHGLVMNADGSNVTELTFDQQPVLLPAWSPDGTSLTAAGPSGLILMNADGSGGRSIFPTYDNIGPFSWRRTPTAAPSAAALTRAKP